MCATPAVVPQYRLATEAENGSSEEEEAEDEEEQREGSSRDLHFLKLAVTQYEQLLRSDPSNLKINYRLRELRLKLDRLSQ